jgi:hypothetical protein
MINEKYGASGKVREKNTSGVPSSTIFAKIDANSNAKKAYKEQAVWYDLHKGATASASGGEFFATSS